MQDHRSTAHDHSPWDGFANLPDGVHYRTPYCGFGAANDKGTHYVQVPPPEEAPSSSGWSFASLLSSILSFLYDEYARGQDSSRAENLRSFYGGQSSQHSCNKPSGDGLDGDRRQKSFEASAPYIVVPPRSSSGWSIPSYLHSIHSVLYTANAKDQDESENSDQSSSGDSESTDANEPRSPVSDDLRRDNDVEVGLRSQIERLENRIKDMEKDFFARSKEFYLAKSRGDELQEALQQEKARAAAFEREIQKSRDVDLQEELEREKARAEAFGREISKNLFDNLQEELQQEKARADDLELVLSMYKARRHGAETLNFDLEKEVREYATLLDGLQTALQQEKARADDLEEELSKYKAWIHGAQARNFDLEKEVKTLLDGLSVHRDRADDLEEELSKYKAWLHGAQARNFDFEKEVREYETLLTELSVHRDRADNLERENRELKDEVGELQSKLRFQDENARIEHRHPLKRHRQATNQFIINCFNLSVCEANYS